MSKEYVVELGLLCALAALVILSTLANLFFYALGRYHGMRSASR